MTKSKVDANDKINAVQEILAGKESISHAAARLAVNKSSIQGWISNYRAYGADFAFAEGPSHYSDDLKQQAVLSYLNGEGSLLTICSRYKIRCKSPLRKWIKQYNSHEGLKSSKTGRTAIMTEGRKTTFDERIEIVQYCIAHDRNFAETAEKYKISYQQARNYTVKYETGGIDALQDRRGKRKPADSLSEVEKLRVELKLERTRRKRAEMEVDFLKKLSEIERRRG